MSEELTPGLYEALVTETLRVRIERAREEGWLVEWKAIDDATLADILARHIHERARERISGIPALDERSSTGSDRPSESRVGSPDLRPTGREPIDTVDPEAQLLVEVGTPLAPVAPGRQRLGPGSRSETACCSSTVIETCRSALRSLSRYIAPTKVDLLCAFVRWAGLRLIRRNCRSILLGGGEMRVIASVYTGSTEKRALDDLVGLAQESKFIRDIADAASCESLAVRAEFRVPDAYVGIVEPHRIQRCWTASSGMSVPPRSTTRDHRSDSSNL